MEQIAIENTKNLSRETNYPSSMTYIVKRLQLLEFRLEKTEVPAVKINCPILISALKTLNEYLSRFLDINEDFLGNHWLTSKKTLIESQGPSGKKEIIRIQLIYFKNYLVNQNEIHWDEFQHTDILNIYWFSNKEIQIKEKIETCLNFLEEEIYKLEKLSQKNSLSNAEEAANSLKYHYRTAT